MIPDPRKRGICGHGWPTDVFYESQYWWFPLWPVDAHNLSIGFRCCLPLRMPRRGA